MDHVPVGAFLRASFIETFAAEIPRDLEALVEGSAVSTGSSLHGSGGSPVRGAAGPRRERLGE